jgi:methyl-CpG-binding domain protein 4
MNTAFGVDIPESPYYLLQEIYIEDPWKMMVCCMMLNQTTRRQVDVIREEFFNKWSTPEEMMGADESEVAKLLYSLGFYNRRARSLMRMSQDWQEKDWRRPIELHGIGKYAQDSWDIFVEGKLPNKVEDHVLTKYVEWRKNN